MSSTRRRLVAVCVAAALLSGCAAPEPRSVEVYVEAAGADGTESRWIECGRTAEYQVHAGIESGSALVTVTDGAGMVHRFEYTEGASLFRDLEGARGNWTLVVEWSAFKGALHTALTC
jgi:hypothetical protein